VARFRREAEAVARLQHPNIVHVHEVGEHDGQPYLVMEYVPGPSLGRRLTGTPLSSRAAAGLLETLARATNYAHRHGVIHRDLKPSNVLLPPNPAAEVGDKTLKTASAADPTVLGAAYDLALTAPKIVDFGLAKLPAAGADPTLSGALLGTPNYMAPEQARGESKHVGPPADVWALGAILYECLTGRPPFQGQTVLDILWLIGEREPVPPSSLNPRVPRDLETICLKCLEKGLARRYATAQELADDLGRYLRDEPIRARPPSAVYQLRKFARRNKGLLTGVAAVFLALVVGLVGTGIGMVRAWAEKDRARQAEQETRTLLAESYAQAGRLAVRRGAWRDALTQFDRALEAGHPDQADLRLQKVRALCAVHDIPNAVEELDALTRRPDLGALAGSVMLWQADIALGRSADEDAALGLVRQALTAGLPPPEREYALGLLATTSPDAVRHFELAVEADPFHQRANGMLALTLVMLGRTQAARERITVARLLFPEDPTFAVLLALALVSEGDAVAARAALDTARNSLGERPLRTARKLVDLLQQVRDVANLLNDDPDHWMSAAITRLLPAVVSAGAEVQALRGFGAGAGLMLPVPPVLVTAFRRPVAAFTLAFLGAGDRAIDDLTRAYHVHPDAFLAFARGLIAFNADRLADAERAFLDATEGSSLIPVRRIARFAVVFCQWERAGREPAARRELIGKAVQNARKLLDLGRLPPWQAAMVATVAIDADDLDLARSVIADWERQAPKDILLWRKRSVVEIKARAYGPAIAAADKILELKPNDAEALRYRSIALERLVRQADELKPMPAIPSK
jgi:tetratricopeptide (TPR) repeat protein